MELFRIFGRDDGSKEVAKERLRLLLVHDRANVSPRFLEMIKGELINVFSNYMEIDENGMDVKLTKTRLKEKGEVVPALIANIPIKRMKHIAKV